MIDDRKGLLAAQALDADDELADFRGRFVIEDPNLIYLDGNSLGRLPKLTQEKVQRSVDIEWGERLIRSWNEGWVDAPRRLGAKIAELIGAQPDEVLVADGVSINLFKLAAAVLRQQTGRYTVLSDEFNFPSDLYILQGLIDLIGGGRRLILARSMDGVTMPNAAIPSLLGPDTALVCLTHVAYRSAYMYDMAAITRQARAHGALVIWDLSHSVGAIPLNVNADGVDLAVGCTYKYLNGGPGAPAFLYVRRDLQEQLLQPVWGWFGDQSPFEFNLSYRPAPDINRFRVGSVPVLSMLAVEPGIDIMLEAGMRRLRWKSVRQSQYLIGLAEKQLFPLGFRLGSPRQPEWRGSHVSLRHPQGYRISRALVEGATGDSMSSRVYVIPDFRSPDYIRLGIAPLYTTFTEIFRAVECMRRIVEDKLYMQFPEERQAVT